MRSALLLLLAATPALAADPPAATAEQREFFEMLAGIVTGSQMQPGDGWFHDAQKKHTFAWLSAKHKNANVIARETFRGPPELFARLDRDADGKLTADDLDWSSTSAQLRQRNHVRSLIGRFDRDFDGALNADEWNGLFKQAAGKAGKVDPEALRQLLYPPAVGGPAFGNPADAPSRLTLLRGLFLNEIGSSFPGPDVGDTAPEFVLSPHDGGKEIALSDYRGKTPVCLVFGNFTCGPFRAQYKFVEDVKKAYGDKVKFLGVYVREAHPSDGWRMGSNDKNGVTLPQPKTTKERTGVATQCVKNLKMTMPLLVDEVNDTVGHAYSGMPSRLVLIDTKGKVVFKSGRGPFGFRPGELDQAISLLMIEERLTKMGRLSLNDAEAWQKLPDVTAGEKAGPLPNWAKVYAESSPKLTAAMLELDYVQRAKNPLDAKLRAKIRYAAAEANQSPYGMATALADLERAGGKRADPNDADPTLAFAKKLTLKAHAITDAEFAALRKLHGDAATVAIVLTVAYANFQDRLLLSLGVRVEDGGPLAPVAVSFAKGYAGAADAPHRLTPREEPAVGGKVTDANWKDVDFDGLQTLLKSQSERPERIRVPAFEELLARAPAGTFDPKRPLKIKWSLVCMGYQPELATAWLNCLRTFGQEAQQDRVFEELLFWVVTRSLQCFY